MKDEDLKLEEIEIQREDLYEYRCDELSCHDCRQFGSWGRTAN
jgi:hypothetical protein